MFDSTPTSLAWWGGGGAKGRISLCCLCIPRQWCGQMQIMNSQERSDIGLDSRNREETSNHGVVIGGGVGGVGSQVM